jgi:hypothetical protein
MGEKRVSVWVQEFTDRPSLVLQWFDPDTGRRKSQSAKTADPKKAEQARADLESDLNTGRYQEASKTTWEHFLERFEDEYMAALRPDTREVYRNVFALFERICNPQKMRSINERTISAFAAGLRTIPGRGRGREGMQHATITTPTSMRLPKRLSWVPSVTVCVTDEGLRARRRMPVLT